MFFNKRYGTLERAACRKHFSNTLKVKGGIDNV